MQEVSCSERERVVVKMHVEERNKKSWFRNKQSIPCVLSRTERRVALVTNIRMRNLQTFSHTQAQ